MDFLDLPIENADFPYSYVSLPEGEALLRQTFVAFYLASPARMAPVLYASTRDYLGYGLDMGGKSIGNPKKI